VVVKPVPAAPFLSLRQHCADMGEAIGLIELVVRKGAGQIKAQHKDQLIVVAHSDFEDDALDLEIGFTLTTPVNTTVTLPGDLAMSLRELEAVEEMAAIVRTGPGYQSHLAYGAIGIWMEANDYRIDGRCREVFLEVPFVDPTKTDTVMEIQFPVAKAA
jgi:effector-binding domain-containing protein